MPKVLKAMIEHKDDFDPKEDQAIIEAEDRAADFEEARLAEAARIARNEKFLATSGATLIEGDPARPRVVVTRRFMGEHEYEPGEVIEIDDQRRLLVLERDRRVRAIAHGEDLWASTDGVIWAEKSRAEVRSASLALV